MTTKDIIKAPLSGAEDSIIQKQQKGKLPLEKCPETGRLLYVEPGKARTLLRVERGGERRFPLQFSQGMVE